MELAQLTHLSTRLVRGWSHLERQKGGIGLRGPGETQLETDRRLIGQRIKSIKKRLDKAHNQKEVNRYSRKKGKNQVVALVGYTNAGKTTLFNCLTENMLYLMIFSAHGGSLPMIAITDMTGLWVGIAIILLIEANALFGKMNPLIASVKAVIHSGLLLTVIFGVLVHYL